jgi:BTB/POZ domain-containing protein 13
LFLCDFVLTALCTVLGSLYLDEITLEPIEVVPTLATATLFQLEGIIDQCVEIMIETVNAEVPHSLLTLQE